MARANENTRRSRYILKVVCEGEKTEPLFFTSLFEDYFAGKDIDASTVPQPQIPEDNDDVSRKRGGYRGRSRLTSSSPIDHEPVIKGRPPLKWVLYARHIMNEEGVNEAWAVFDRDQHPACREAFEEVDKLVDGKKVNIAFSSRSFEYYLLLHFEYLYHPFCETECNSKTRLCGTTDEEASNCHGTLCINGYARSIGYWTETKTSKSTYLLVKDRLMRGIANAIRLRAESDSKENTPIYERNPYTNADRLIGRVIGIVPIDKDVQYNYSYKSDAFTAVFSTGCLEICNRSRRSMLITPKNIIIYNLNTCAEHKTLGHSCLLQSDEHVSFEIALKHDEILLLKIFDVVAMFVG